MHKIHRQHVDRSTFKILGILFDNRLLMHHAIHDLAIGAGWRLKSLLRASRYFSQAELVRLYKAQVLSFVEAGSLAFGHAPVTTLERLERIQRRFLRHIDLTAEDALMYFGLAPLSTRRCFSALGVLHKRNLQTLPGAISDMFPRCGELLDQRTRL